MDKIKTQQELLEENNILRAEMDQLKTEVEKLKKFKTEKQNTKNDSKRKNAEEVDKLNTDRFRDLVNSTDGIVWEADAQTFKFTFVSEKAERLLGYPIKDWYKDGFWANNIYEEDKVKTINYCSSQTKKKLPHDFEYRFVSKNGEIFWLRDIVSVVVKNGIPYKLRGIMVDITKLKEAEHGLIENGERLNEALEITRLGTFSFDDSTDLFETSSICDEIIGIDQSYTRDIQGWINFVHPEDYENAQLLLDKANLEYVSTEFRIIRPKDKKIIWILGHAKKEYDHKGVRTKITGTIKDISKRKQADNDLRTSELRLREAQAVAHIGSFEGDIYNDELWWSDELFSLFGLKPNEFKITKDGFNQLIHPDEKDEYISKLMSCLETGNPFKREFRGRHKSGEWRYFETVAGITYDSEGEIIGMRGTVQDITDHKLVELELIKAEETAIKSEIYLDNVINNIGDPVFVKDDQSRLLLVNDSFCNLLKLTKTEIIGKTLEENVAPEEIKSFLNIDKQVITDGKENINEEFLTLKGEKSKTLSTRKNRFIDGDGNKFLIGTIRDITESKKIEISLKDSEIRFRTIFENSPVLINAFDKDGKCILWNKQCEQTFGWTLNELNTNDNSLKLFYPDTEIEQEVLLSITVNPDGKFKEWNPLTKAGKKLTVMWANFGLQDGLTYSIGYDITEQRLSELKLNRSNQLLEETQAIAKLGGWELDIASNNLFWTKETYNIHDTTPEEFNPNVDAGVGYFLPDSRRVISKALEAAMTHGEGYDLKLETLTTKGRHIHVRTTCEVTCVEGKPTKLIGVFQDITESVLAEKSLRMSADRFERWKSSNFIGILHFTVKGKIIDANDTLLDMLGYSKQDLTEGRVNWNKLTPTEFSNLDQKALEEASEKGTWTPFEKEYYHKDGHRVPILIGGSVFLETPDEYIVFIIDLTERKIKEIELLKSKKEAQENEARFKALHNASFGGIAIHDKGVIMDCNKGLSIISGYSTVELIGMDGLLLIEESFRESVMAKILAEYEKSYEVVGVRKNKEVYPLRLEAREIPYKGEKVRIVEFRDITNEIKSKDDLKKAYKKLKNRNKDLTLLSDELSEKNRMLLESKNRFREIFDKSPIPIWEEDFSDVIELLNKKKSETKNLRTYLNENPYFVKKCVARIKILKVSEVTYGVFGIKNISELIKLLRKSNSKKSISALKEEFLSIASNKREFTGETEFINKNGEVITVIIKSVIDKEGRAIVSLNDITPLKKVEKSLKESQLSLLKSQEIANIGSYKLDLVTGIWTLTLTLENILGINDDYEKNFAGWLNVVHPDERDLMTSYFNEEVLSKRGKFDKEYRIKRISNQEERWVYAVGELEFNDDGVPIKMVGTVQDITDRKISEQELLKSKEKAEESNRLKTEFLHNMSHEIRTPMNGILGFTQMLNDAYLTDEKRANFVNIIQNSGKELLHIIDDILEISKLETKQVRLIESEVCMNDTFFELFSIFDIKAKEQGISLYFKKGLLDRESTIYTDKVKLNKILSNLLENALKFTTRGYVAFGYNLIKNNTFIEIYVKDTGIGIEPEKQKIIFERFSQAEKKISRKAGGLGLGLSIAKENAELLGGEISVESEMMGGAKFIVTIPYKPVKIKSIANDEIVSIQKVRHSYTILIAEDEEVNFLFLEILLMDKLKLSCKIIHAIDGEEAVEICKNNPYIDLVLMDIKMPKMNGYVATEEIKKIRPNLPIVAQTAYSTREDMEKAKAAGCSDFISKPIDKKILNDVIKKYMKK